MPRNRGDVWWGPALHKPGPAYRPWLIVSDGSHPFSAEECIALAMTTRRYPKGIEVPRRAWVHGGSDTPAFVSPWYITTIKHADFDRQQGTVATDVVEAAVEELHRYTPRSKAD